MEGFTVVALGCFTPPGGPPGGGVAAVGGGGSDGPCNTARGGKAAPPPTDGGGGSGARGEASAIPAFPDPSFSVFEDRGWAWALKAIPPGATRWG